MIIEICKNWDTNNNICKITDDLECVSCQLQELINIDLVDNSTIG